MGTYLPKYILGYGWGALNYGGISAIDIALWDIKGKALGVPVYELLGGKTNDKLRTYASQIQFDWGLEAAAMVTPADYARATEKAMAQGYTAVKVDPVGFDLEGRWMDWSNYGLLENKQLEVAVERIAAIRQAGGKDLDIIVELHSLTDTNTAIQLGKQLEKFNCFYYEEATAPEMPKLFDEIANAVNIPMATGERVYGRRSYAQFFEGRRSLQIIQPDLGNCGGITEGKKICDMANAYDIGVQMHICGGPIATAAALQLEAVIPNFVIHEHHACALLEANRELCIHEYQPENGYFSIPDKPGIGQELSEKALRESRIVTIK
ncbi:mandelate racemase/muconate lactonizing enzyme family protein [Photobacterium sp. GJ3]|uniref:mandelate racemase/muconate lactonizing enzyme family protein n=1 Tax=Photobacterium sp. GJ3 TaxID=2829502 RepID=UPI00211102A6|nr:mandelate racemase/muconate lactonizing enzyme family protein [Photobacterium sp. GJ3]